jgi:hypothetical protein
MIRSFRSKCFVVLVFPCLIAVGFLSTAKATVLTYSFQGTVSGVDPALAPTFSAGQVLSGSYSFQSTTPPRAGSNSTFAVFDALTSLNFSVPGYTASTFGAPEIQVDNNPPLPDHDRYSVVARASDGLSGPAVGGNTLNSFSFRLDDSTNTVFTDALILPITLSLSSFDSNHFFIFFTDANQGVHVVDGTLSALTPVPEPVSLVVWSVFGALGVAFGMRRHCKPGN